MIEANTRRPSSQPQATARDRDPTMVEQRNELKLSLPSHARAPGIARRELAAFARGAGLDGRQYQALRLLVSELVTNAVRHSGVGNSESVNLCVVTDADVVRIEVRDQGSGFDLPRTLPVPHEGGGYGLFIVDRLCARWGVERNGVSLVWCELAGCGETVA